MVLVKGYGEFQKKLNELERLWSDDFFREEGAGARFLAK
jgi:hypothetical protein